MSALAEIAAFGYGLASIVDPRWPSPSRFRWADRSLVALMAGSLAGGWIKVQSENRQRIRAEARQRREAAARHERDRQVRRAAEVLGIGTDADRATIRSAFCASVRRVHPDLHGADGDAIVVSRLVSARDLMLAALEGGLP